MNGNLEKAVELVNRLYTAATRTPPLGNTKSGRLNTNLWIRGLVKIMRKYNVSWRDLHREFVIG